MTYMSGDSTNLDNNGFADLKEMKRAGSTNEVNLLAQFSRGVRNRPTKRYYLTKDEGDGTLGNDVVENLGNTNSADPKALEDFIRWSIENFPAENYMLIIWGHANGIDDENIPNAINAELGQGNHTSGFEPPHA